MNDPEPDRATRAYLDFLRRAKAWWARDLYGAVARDFAAAAGRAGPGRLADADDAEAALEGVARYQYFGWLERHLQHLKYASPRGILAAVAAEREALAADLDAARETGIARGELRLSPGFVPPRYFSAVDYHQHPGGVAGDALAGVAYDFGRRTTLPAHLDPDEIHGLFTAAVPAGHYRRILDIGCGTGRSTLPFARRFPAAELHGIDVAGPCLVRAFQRSDAAGVVVHWSQQAAEHADFPDGHFDLVHSTFLLHEVPRPALAAITREVFRLLAPGGWFVSLDFHSPPGGVFGAFIHYGHALRNNEVFMRSFCETDYLGMQREAGFREAAMLPFDDGSGVFAPDQVPPAWRFPAQLFVATKQA
jgi:SAM-dependent methyltransferase